MGRRVLVCGGRRYSDVRAVNEWLDWLHGKDPITLLINGGASGADTLGKMWAESRGVPVVTEYALWTTHGRKAGPIRNQKMLEDHNPDLVVAFPGGRGTADMVRRANAARLDIIEIAGDT